MPDIATTKEDLIMKEKKKQIAALTESVSTSVATTCLVIKKWMEANINQRVFVRITMAT